MRPINVNDTLNNVFYCPKTHYIEINTYKLLLKLTREDEHNLVNISLRRNKISNQRAQKDAY